MGRSAGLGRESRYLREARERAARCDAARRSLSADGIERSYTMRGAWIKAGLKVRVLSDALRVRMIPKGLLRAFGLRVE